MAISASFIHTWYVMPRKPRFIHPVRQVRTCLGHTQPSFAKLIGCKAITVQRIENGKLKLSAKLANSILEATGADPVSLRAGLEAKAMDMMGNEYSKEALTILENILPFTDKELRYYLHKLIQYLELLLIASNRRGKFKAYAMNGAIQESFQKLAEDFDLEKAIHNFLIEQGSVDKKIYRVSDLRKFTEYARILGFKDNKRFKPDKLITFTVPRGWMRNYYVMETPVLPHGADMKLRDAEYFLDDERKIPDVIKEAIAQALYWKIELFRRGFCEKSIR
jgi:DNA-binding XRE family transcriptional regulator